MKKFISTLAVMILVLSTFTNVYAAEVSEKPAFEALEIMSTSLADSSVWVKGETYQPDTYSYNLGTMKPTSTGFMFSGTNTKFDIDKYDAIVKYTDATGAQQIKNFVNNGKISLVSCANIALGASTIEVVISDKADATNSTTYSFAITRPYPVDNTMKSNSIVVTPSGRAVSKTPYKGKTEGTLFRVKDGVEATLTGVYSTYTEYNAYLLNNATTFDLKLVTPTAGAAIRYSTDDKATWTEYTDIATITAGDVDSKTVYLQVISADTAINGTGFDNAENIKDYQVTVYFPKVDTTAVEMKTATVDVGALGQDITVGTLTYYSVVPEDFTTSTLTYTVADGAVVTINKVVQTPNADGSYSVEFKAQTKIMVATADGALANTYIFNIAKKSVYDMPDEVVDFLVVNSQYTNTSPYALYPETSITSNSPMKSLGNFGGYITFKYDKPLVDNPNNKFGMDFYVQGNAMMTGGTGDTGSFREPGQVWVSEDNVTWYALAGSEHYEDTTITDYEVTYTKTAGGKTAWLDNQGQSAASNFNFPSESIYHSHNFGANSDEITISGVYLPADENGYAAASKFGYADALVNSKQDLSTRSVEDTNPYVEYTANGSGFDLAWAVDENGLPIDVSNKEFSYVKVVTASNIVAGGLGEKSTEINGVIRTTAQKDEVGMTAALTGVTINEDIVLNFEDGKTTYDVLVDKSLTGFDISVNGAADTDNIYVNNQRIASTEKATGFVFGEDNAKTVRVIVQNGDCEPYIAIINVMNKEMAPVTVTTPEQIMGKAGTEFNVVVTANTWTENIVKLVDGVYNIPEGLEIVDVKMGSSITGGELQYNLADEKLRFAYMSKDLEDISLNTGTFPVELMTITLKLTEDVVDTTKFTISVDSIGVKTDSTTGTELDVEQAIADMEVISPIPAPVASARVLYTGDDTDLIASTQQAVAVEILNLQESSKVMFGDIQMMYSDQMTAKKGVDTYVAITSTDVKVEALNDVANYTITAETPVGITFADVNEDKVVNAQDALDTLAFWLRKVEIQEEKEILTANVNASSAITTSDVLAIMEHVVNARELDMVTK